MSGLDIYTVNDLLASAEEAVADIRLWTVHSDTNALAISVYTSSDQTFSTYLDYTGILMTIRALAGETIGRNADTAFDTGSWREANYLQKLQECSGNPQLTMNWCVLWTHLPDYPPDLVLGTIASK